MAIDAKAIIDPAAQLDEDVSIGPFAVIGAGVSIGSGTTVGPHTVIKGVTRIGKDNKIAQFASVGDDPQDKKYAGEETYLEIGDRNVIREFTTINRGTVQDKKTTTIGNDNLLMAYTHVAHDCQIGNHVIMANAASLGGHVQLQDWAILGGFSIVHQFTRIGAHSFAAMGSAIAKDVPPYVTVGGHPAKPHGINSEGLKRRGFNDEELAAIKQAYRLVYRLGHSLEEATLALEEMATENDALRIFSEFLNTRARSIVR